jgi:ACR3 family arsenite efflux pump ArsB
MKTLNFVLFIIIMSLVLSANNEEFMSVSYIVKSALIFILIGVSAGILIRGYRKKRK